MNYFQKLLITIMKHGKLLVPTLKILKKVSELPGIMSVKLLGRAELAALRVLRDGIQDLGVSLDLVSKEASVDLIHGEATTLVVFYEGEFRPGVREILTIVARQFSEID